eukprot:scaffold1172_cov247-Pinguiococcus_pyrenoidosus.AAC.8
MASSHSVEHAGPGLERRDSTGGGLQHDASDAGFRVSCQGTQQQTWHIGAHRSARTPQSFHNLIQVLNGAFLPSLSTSGGAGCRLVRRRKRRSLGSRRRGYPVQVQDSSTADPGEGAKEEAER